MEQVERLLGHIVAVSGETAAQSARDFANGLPLQERKSFWAQLDRVFGQPLKVGRSRRDGRKGDV